MMFCCALVPGSRLRALVPVYKFVDLILTVSLQGPPRQRFASHIASHHSGSTPPSFLYTTMCQAEWQVFNQYVHTSATVSDHSSRLALEINIESAA